MSEKVTVITTTSGMQLITTIAADHSDFYLLRNPMEMEIDNSDAYVQKIYLSRYIPFSDDNLVVIYKTAVEGIAICSKRYTDMYDSKLKQFEASKAAVTDADKTEVIDGHIEQTEDSREDAEFNEEFGIEDEVSVTPTKTYH